MADAFGRFKKFLEDQELCPTWKDEDKTRKVHLHMGELDTQTEVIKDEDIEFRVDRTGTEYQETEHPRKRLLNWTYNAALTCEDRKAVQRYKDKFIEQVKKDKNIKDIFEIECYHANERHVVQLEFKMKPIRQERGP